jgi:hypothetical protein
MPRINSIGAYDKGGSNEIGAYGFRSVASTRSGTPVSNDIGAYDTQGNDIGAWGDDQAPPATGSSAISIIQHYYTHLLGGSRNV